MNVVTVLGDINKVQVNLNFYLKLTSTDSIKSVEALRRFMFDKFRQEDNIRYSNLASAYFEKQRQEELASLKALEEQKKEEISYVSTGVLLEDPDEEISEKINNEDEVQKENNFQYNVEYSDHGCFLEDDEEYKSTEVSYVPQGVILDDTKDYRQEGIEDPDTQTILESKDEDVEYSEHGIFLTDSEDVLTSQNDSSIEYSEHGIFLTDAEDNLTLQDGSPIEYLEHGVFLEDCDVNEKETSVKSEYSSTGVILDDREDTSEENNISDEFYNESSEKHFGEYTDNEMESDVWGDFTEGNEENCEESLPFESEIEDDNVDNEIDVNNTLDIDSNEEDFFEEEFSDDDDSSSIFCVPSTNKSKEVPIEVKEKTNKNLNTLVSASKEVKLPDKSLEEQIIPTDLRAFIKQFNNPTIEFTKQYFSEKEIKKQITQSRVFKRKNRLYI